MFTAAGTDGAHLFIGNRMNDVASMPLVRRLVNRYMVAPIHMNLSPNMLTVDKIRQSYITVDEEKKFELLCRVMEREKPRQCIIFCERKRWADELYRDMRGFPAGDYLIFYRPLAGGGGIVLMRVVHGARNLRALFRRKRS